MKRHTLPPEWDITLQSYSPMSAFGRAIAKFLAGMSVYAKPDDFSVIGADATGYVLPLTVADQAKDEYLKGLVFVGRDDDHLACAIYAFVQGKFGRIIMHDEQREITEAIVRACMSQAISSAEGGEIPFRLEVAPQWLRIPHDARLIGRRR